MASTTTTRAVTFYCRAKDACLIMQAGRPIYNDHGEVVGGRESRHIQFVDGRYQTRDDEEIEYIRARMNAPDGPPGLFEMEPGAEAPDPSPVLAQLAVATREEAEQILAAELEGHDRPIVVQTAEAVITKRKGGRPPKNPDDPEESGGPLG